MATFLNGKEITTGDDGSYEANCSVCFQDGRCNSVTYPRIEEICAAFKITPHYFAVCQNCLEKTDKKTLYTNLMDYFVMEELYRWLLFDKDGIVQSDLEFKALLQVAKDQGILYREEKRTRHRITKEEKVLNTGMISMLKKQDMGDYTPNALYQSLFKKLYEG